MLAEQFALLLHRGDVGLFGKRQLRQGSMTIDFAGLDSGAIVLVTVIGTVLVYVTDLFGNQRSLECADLFAVQRFDLFVPEGLRHVIIQVGSRQW